MLDLEPIKARLDAATSWTGSGDSEAMHRLAAWDIASLIAEVERLRDEKSNYEADRLDCARQINDFSRKVEDLQHANISLKNTMDIRVAAPPSTLAKLHAEVERLRAAIDEHRRTVKPGDDYCGADVILWRAIDA